MAYKNFLEYIYDKDIPYKENLFELSSTKTYPVYNLDGVYLDRKVGQEAIILFELALLFDGKFTIFYEIDILFSHIDIAFT